MSLVQYVHGVTDPNEWVAQSHLVCADPSKAIQSAAEDCDINVIVDRYMRTGVLPSVAMPPMVGDFTDVPDLRSALDIIRQADESFMALPAAIRGRFENDPSKFVDFVYSSGEPQHLDELRRMGLAVPAKGPVPEVIQKVQIVEPVAPKV